jgi:hypothetical protein
METGFDNLVQEATAAAKPSEQVVWLLVGAAALGLALLVLMRTRWGQAKPLSVCMVLSILAHLLLMVYAYCFQTLVAVPPTGREQIVQVNLLPDFEDPPPPVETPPDETPPDETPPDETPPDETPPDEWPPIERPPIQPRSIDAQQIESPSTDPPPFEETQPDEPKPWDDFAASPPEMPPGPIAPEPMPIASMPAERDPSEPPAPMDAAEREAIAKSPDLPELPDLPDLPDLLDPPDDPPNAPLPLPVDPLAATPLQPVPLAMPEPDAPRPLRDESANDASSPTAASSRLVQVDQSLVPNEQTPAELPQDLVSGMAAVQQITSEAAETIMSPASPDPQTRGRMRADGQPMPERYWNRIAQDRQAIILRGGGSEQTEAAVQAALAWLAANQERDGRWNARRHNAGHETQVLGHDRSGAGSDADTGITGLAILAFLGAGQSHLEGEYVDIVRRGLEFLLRSQADDGNLAGKSRLFARMYCHGMAALAISEAYAMTGDARLRPFVQRAMHYTSSAQNPHDGGWRYLPGDAGDMSQFGWQVLAIQSAHLAGVSVPDATHRGMRRFLESCSTGRHGGLASYRPHGPTTAPMTAEALFCRLFLDARRSEAAIREAVDLLIQESPQSGEINLYYWYYATIALFQLQGPAWETWNQHLTKRLLETQVTSGPDAGSWPTRTVWGGYGGRVYTTAMAALCLEVYYRYLPLLEAPHP